jgi:hypothetical protein
LVFYPENVGKKFKKYFNQVNVAKAGY